MQELAELERRIAAALQRIGAGIEQAAGSAPEAVSGPHGPSPADQASDPSSDQSAEIARLTAELAAERARTADLRQRLQAVPKPVVRTPSELEARVEKLTLHIDVQGLELQRMRKNVVQLRENLRGLRRAAADKLPDADQINRAMMAELESIRVTRYAEMAELDEIIAELDPLIAEVPAHA